MNSSAGPGALDDIVSLVLCGWLYARQQACKDYVEFPVHWWFRRGSLLLLVIKIGLDISSDSQRILKTKKNNSIIGLFSMGWNE